MAIARVLLLAAMAVLSGCASMFPFDYTEMSAGPTQLGTDWTTVSFKAPMEAALRQKGVLLELPPGAKWTDVYQGELRINGKQIKLSAEAVGADGAIYPLPFVSPILPTGYKELYVVLLSQQFPQRVVLNRVRVKASESVTLGRVLWMNSTPH